jgi:hypothetical protein
MYRVSLLAGNLYNKLAGCVPARKIRVCVLNALRRERILLVDSDLDRPVCDEIVKLLPIASHLLGLDEVVEGPAVKPGEYMRACT